MPINISIVSPTQNEIFLRDQSIPVFGGVICGTVNDEDIPRVTAQLGSNQVTARVNPPEVIPHTNYLFATYSTPTPLTAPNTYGTYTVTAIAKYREGMSSASVTILVPIPLQ
jgi:hypothetical protein